MLSKFLRERLSEFLSEEALNSLGNPLPQAIRVNTLKISEKELVSRLEEKDIKLEKIRWVRHGYYVKKAPFSMGATPEYLLGYYFLQDPTSMYACEVLKPKGLVLDMAAAPGGKTTYLSQLMENKGCIIDIEINKTRIRSLKSNINRMNAENVITIRMDAREV
ncbi:MAG: RNA methyltransferase, partial [Candidatus Hydrothermarchaeota archaeon]